MLSAICYPRHGITVERLADRKALLKGFDDLRRDADATGAIRGMDAFTEQAFGLLTSSRMADALDLSKEDPKVVERYVANTDEAALVPFTVPLVAWGMFRTLSTDERVVWIAWIAALLLLSRVRRFRRR